MSNIVRFPGRDPQDQAEGHYIEQEPHGSRLAGLGAGVLRGLLAAVRAVLFHLLLWLRPLIVGACHFVAGLGLLTFLAGLLFLSDPHYKHMIWGVGGMSLALSVLAFSYDRLLMMFAPAGVELCL